ncbi:hypothetical protein [Parasitella parasitica]|uniref:Uncharacterized protein n=1 Tax=Parasitella parasitica TaxID=35722 RepID=A0A0B7MUY2_9FUNG|nr:hypothetical protein [Parasitella parasitica]CEP09552.1 hypothetical protein [Parasitella parasitica]
MPMLLHYLLKVIMQLPPLPMSFSWHNRWFSDIPLRCALRSAHSSVVALPTIPLKWLVSDILHPSLYIRASKTLPGVARARCLAADCLSRPVAYHLGPFRFVLLHSVDAQILGLDRPH